MGSRRRKKARAAHGLRTGPLVLAAVAVATLVGAWLRLCDLGAWSLWIDEAHTFRDATMPFAGENGFLEQARSDYPLAFLMLRFLLDAHWIGDSEGWLRLPFACIGIVTVPMVWLAGRRLVGGGAAAVAAALIALMPWHLYWSQNARGYVAVVLAATVAVARTWSWVETQRVRDLVVAILAIGIGTLFHSTTALTLCGFVAFLLLRRQAALGMRTVLWAAGALVLVVLLVPFVPTARDFLRAKSDASLVHFVTTTGYFFRPLLLAAAAAGLALAHRRYGRERTLLLGCFAVVPFLCLAAVGTSLALTTARYAICALPVLLWLCGIAVVDVARLVPRDRGIGGVLLAGCFGLSLLLDFGQGAWNYYHAHCGDRARWRDACAAVEKRFADRRLRVLTTSESTVLYYLQRDFWANGMRSDGFVEVRTVADWLIGGMQETIVDGQPVVTVLHEPGGDNHLRWQLQSATAAGADFVVMVSRPELDEKDPGGGIWRGLQQEFELIEYLPLWVGPKDESIYVYVPREQ